MPAFFAAEAAFLLLNSSSCGKAVMLLQLCHLPKDMPLMESVDMVLGSSNVLMRVYFPAHE